MTLSNGAIREVTFVKELNIKGKLINLWHLQMEDLTKGNRIVATPLEFREYMRSK